MIEHSRPWITAGDCQAVWDTLSGLQIAKGRAVRLLERTVAEYVGASDCVATSSGTAGLILALAVLDLPPEAEVIIPTYTCRNVAEAVISVGLVPVLCDVGGDWNITVDSARAVWTDRTAAVIVVHIFGTAARTTDFEALGVPVIEDACQAFGARHNGQMVGTQGTLGVFSFHATKCLATGEGGAVVCRDEGLAERMRVLRDGQTVPGPRRVDGMSDLQAALGLSQLARYTHFLERRRQISRQYLKQLAHCPVRLPSELANESIFFRFPVRVTGDFDVLGQRFREKGVQVRKGVDMLLHHAASLTSDGFATSERLFQETLCLPIYPALTDQELNIVIEACQSVWVAP